MSDPREELRELIADAIHSQYVMDWEHVAADRIVAAGWVKLSDLASDPAVIERVAAALDVHRWKYMGVDWCSCECGAVMRGDGSLTEFPGDKEFRMHIGRSVASAVAASPASEEGQA